MEDLSPIDKANLSLELDTVVSVSVDNIDPGPEASEAEFLLWLYRTMSPIFYEDRLATLQRALAVQEAVDEAVS